MFKRLSNSESFDPCFAVADAEYTSRRNRSLWPEKYISAAERWANRVRAVYPNHRVFFNIRKRFLAIKVEGPSVDTRDTTEVRDFDWQAANHDISIVETRTGVIYRLHDVSKE